MFDALPAKPESPFPIADDAALLGGPPFPSPPSSIAARGCPQSGFADATLSQRIFFAVRSRIALPSSSDATTTEVANRTAEQRVVPR